MPSLFPPTAMRGITRGRRLIPHLRRNPCARSFVAGTIVLAASGAMAIEDVQAGMEVWAYDHDHNEWHLEVVEETFEHEYEDDLITLTLTFDNGRTEELTATGAHPFWVIEGDELAARPAAEEVPSSHQGVDPFGETSSGKWIEARWLRVGDHFLTRTGKSATVSGLTIRIERVRVYNLQVARLHNYAVGVDGVLVHNACPLPPPGVGPGWQFRGASPRGRGKNWWDPHGGEYRYHPADRYHSPHWDYNPWDRWNSPWRHVTPDGQHWWKW